MLPVSEDSKLSVVQEEMVNRRPVRIILHGTVCVIIGSYSQYKTLFSCFYYALCLSIQMIYISINEI